MAIKEIKREWSPCQLGYVKHFLLHDEEDVKDLPRCSVGSTATVSATDNEYVYTVSGWKLKSECDEDGGTGGGGGGPFVQPDWNQTDETKPDFIRNKPFYSTPVTVIPEQTFTPTAEGASIEALFTPEAGSAVKVYFDGEVYTCTALAGFGGIIVGDINVAFGMPAEIPFVIMLVDAGAAIMTADITADHTVKAVGEEITRIPAKYYHRHLYYFSTNDKGIYKDPAISKAVTNDEWEKTVEMWPVLLCEVTKDTDGNITMGALYAPIRLWGNGATILTDDNSTLDVHSFDA